MKALINESDNSGIQGQYYVYALINPRNKIPFYVGKGASNRIVGHFKTKSSKKEKPANNETEGDEIGISVGWSPQETVNKNTDPTETQKKIAINNLRDEGFNETHIARVVGRRLSRDVAYTIEALMIKNVYGRGDTALTNIADGHNTRRFRAKEDWEYIKGYDLDTDKEGLFIEDDGTHLDGKFYVYVLREPTGKIFYVGKGQGGRLAEHFKNASKNNGEPEVDRLEEIRRLTGQGVKPVEIGRVVARVDTAALAFMIESFYIKFVVGFGNLHNIQPGHASGLFRSYSDWELRAGFDIPIVVKKGQKRLELLDIFLGEGLDTMLQEVVDMIASADPKLKLKFSEPKLVDAGELAVLASIPDIEEDVKLRIQIRPARRFQVMLKPVSKPGQEWMKSHFSRLGAYPLRRIDDTFFPKPWKGADKVTSDPKVAAIRALQLVALTQVKGREALRDLLPLLEGLPYPGGGGDKTSQRIA